MAVGFCTVARSGCGGSARRGAGASTASDRAPRGVSMLLRSLVTVAGALAAAQLAYAAVAIGSVHFTSTAAMALQNAQQVQSIMLTHHDVEQHAHIGLVHDGDGLCTLSPAGVRQRQFPVLGCQDQWLNASSFQYFGYTAAADSWWLGAPQLLMQEDVHTARVLLAVRTWSLYTSLAVHSNGPGHTIALGWRDMLTPFATEAAAAVAAASELLWRDAIAARLLVLLDFDGFDACAGVPAGEAMPDLLGVSAGCGLDGCSKPGLLMTLLLTNKPRTRVGFACRPHAHRRHRLYTCQ